MPKSSVTCSTCGKQLKRWLINPETKKQIANFFCDTKCKGDWQRKQRENLGFTKEWLEHQYLVLGKSAVDIGKEIGRNSKGVWTWINDYGIPKRPRGHLISNLVMDGSSFRGKKHTEETKKKLSDMALADGRVPWGKGNDPSWKGKTGEMHPSYKGGLTPDRQAFYSSVEWVEVVKQVWKRDNAICQRCGKHHNTAQSRGTFHIHHIESFMNKERRAELDNLVLLCKPCHLFVHSKKNVDKQFLKGK
jgi:hypothetical protein